MKWISEIIDWNNILYSRSTTIYINTDLVGMRSNRHATGARTRLFIDKCNELSYSQLCFRL